MSSRVATTKQTSGAGYSFENQVVAYALAFMLAGHSPYIRLRGVITRVDSQVHVDGWDLDDLLLEMRYQAETYKVAFSIKSNVQVTNCKAPAEFVEQAWSLFLHEEGSAFDVEKDWMGIITAPLPEKERYAINSLLKKSRIQDAHDLAKRVFVSYYANECERDLFKSFAPSNALAIKYNLEEYSIGNLLKRVMCLQYDLESADSKDAAQIIFLCGQLLEDGSSSNAEGLWQFLCGKAEEIRKSGGGITRTELIEITKTNFNLSDFPDYRKDWRYLKSKFGLAGASVKLTVGGEVNIQRNKKRDEVLSALGDQSLVVLLGQSGSGKSALAMEAAQQIRTSSTLLWFDAGRLREGCIDTIEVKMEHTFTDVLSKRSKSLSVIVLDGVERLSRPNDFVEVGRLLRSVCSDKNDNWSIMATCQNEAWSRILLELSRYSGTNPWQTVDVEYPSNDELQPVREAYPFLKNLAWRPQLRPLLRNLHILDMLARASELGQIPPGNILCESDLALWWWSNVVSVFNKSLARNRFLKRFASECSDVGIFEKGISQIEPSEAELLPGLEDIIKVNYENGNIYFGHDIYADWARLFRIKEENDLTEFIKERANNPFWYRAIRLFGLQCLEKQDGEYEWLKILDEAPEVHDLFLESIVFAVNVRGLLEKLRHYFFSEDNDYLNRLLVRFIHAATVPNPRFMAMVSDMDIDPIEAATHDRLPIWVYWPDMLEYLADNVGFVVKYAFQESAEIAKTWLRFTPLNAKGRNEAAILALAVAWEAYRTKAWEHNKSKKIAYKAALFAYPDKPENVTALALKAAGRFSPDQEDGDPNFHYRPPKTVDKMTGNLPYTLEYQEPWPDGPTCRADDNFRYTCLHTDAFWPIMRNQPALAQEIILSLLIELRPPKQEPDWSGSYDLLLKDMGLVSSQDFYPRFYIRGPFLRFLNIDPEPALKTIIKLVDFATERWMEARNGEITHSIIDVPLQGGMKGFVGDDKVFHFYHGHAWSDIVSSSLMAIEKWFYVKLDADEDISPFIELIFNEANSAAFVGLLGEIGRYKPSLFLDILAPLLQIWEVYWQEKLFKVDQHGMGTPFSPREGEWFWKLSREWDGMPHRNIEIINIAVHLFANHTPTRQKLEQSCESWKYKSRQDGLKYSAYLNSLIELFSINNWNIVDSDNGGKEWKYVPPETVKLNKEEEEQHNKAKLLLYLPYKCRKILDGDEEISDQEALTLVEQAKSIENFSAEEAILRSPVQLAGALCGVVAVISVEHRPILDAHEDIKEWYDTIINKYALCPPESNEIDFPVSIGGIHWDDFLCQAIISEWLVSLQSKKVRTMVANLVASYHYSATGYMISDAYKQRASMGDDFWRLLGLAMKWSKIRYDIHEIQDTEKTLENQAKKKKIKKCETEWKKAIKGFVAAKSSVDLGLWGVNALDSGKIWWSNSGRYIQESSKDDIYFKSPRIDIQLIEKVIGGLFLPDDAFNAEEKNNFFDVWEQLLAVILTGCYGYNRNGKKLENSKVEARLPYEVEYWALRRLAVVTSQMCKEEKPERFWKPILALGGRAHVYVESFISEWLRAGLKKDDISQMIEMWREMLDYCLSNSIWIEHNDWSYETNNLWLNMLGLPDYTLSVFKDRDVDIVWAMAAYHVRLAPIILRDYHRAKRYISWLCDPCSRRLRMELLPAILNVAEKENEYWWRDGVARAVSMFLVSIWNTHNQQIKRDKGVLGNFNKLLKIAAFRKDKVALELTDTISLG